MRKGQGLARAVRPACAVSAGALLLILFALPAPVGSQQSNYGLTAICVDTVPDPAEYHMRVRNNSDEAQPFTWRDQVGGESGAGIAPARSDTFFPVLRGLQRHTIIVNIGGSTLVKATNTNVCRGSITVTKTVEGPGPAGASYPIRVSGDSGFDQEFSLVAGGSRRLDVPGTVGNGSVPVGQSLGGYLYSISEHDGRGGDVTVSPDSVVINALSDRTSAITNRYPVTPDPPIPPIPPVPPDPPVLPAPPNEADLLLTKSVSPNEARVGDVVTYSVRVENQGPGTAEAVVGRDIPQRDEPNRVARVLSIDVSQGSCILERPVVCQLGSIPSGGAVTLTARVRPGVTGLLRNLANVTSTTPDPNVSNNQDRAGLFVDPGPGRLRLVKTAAKPRVAPGEKVAFTLTVASRGPYDAFNVQVCDRLPRGLRIVSAPRAGVRGPFACWALRELDVGEKGRFRLVARAYAVGTRTRRILNVAAGRAEDVRVRIASARVSILPAGGPRACPAAKAHASC